MNGRAWGKVTASVARMSRVPVEKLPITISIREAERESSIRGWKQCPSVYAGRESTTFCIRGVGHDGDHRGTGRQWRKASPTPGVALGRAAATPCSAAATGDDAEPCRNDATGGD